MKNVIVNIMMLLTVFCMQSCQEKVNRDVLWPDWASRPIIENAAVTASGTSVVAGSEVTFTADVHDDFNTLSDYIVSVKYGDNIVYRHTAQLEGNQASIKLDFIMPFAAYLEDGDFYPEVSLQVRNVENGSNSVRVANDNNIMVVRPESPASLYIVDIDGNILEMHKTGETYGYSAVSGNDSPLNLGTSFWIAERLSGTSPDFSGLVWGTADGILSVVREGGDPIKTPDSSGYGFKNMGFDIYTFELDGLVAYTVNVDRSGMSSSEESGVSYLSMENVRLIRDCEVIFTGFGNLADMLQPDRFEIIDGTTAKFTGHTQDWSIWYDVPDNWLIVNYAVNNTSGQLWVTGTKSCFPLGNDDTVNELNYFAGDGKVRYASLSAVKDEEGDFRILLYLKDEFALQLYRWVAWGTVVSMESLTPDICYITDDGIYIMQGPSFIPGVYLLKVSFTDDGDSSGTGAKAMVSLDYVSL